MGRPPPTHEAIRAFAQRRWDLIAREKRAFVAARFKAEGPMAARAAAMRLLDRWRALHPDPLPAMREADLEALVALKRKLDKARHGFVRR